MLRWQDLSLDATDPKTGEPKPVCHLTPNNGWQPKDGEARDIPICTPLLSLLKQHRQVEGFLLQAEKGRPGRRRGGKGWIYGHLLSYDGDINAVTTKKPANIESLAGFERSSCW